MKNEEGFVIGYKMIAETAEDTPIIEKIRDLNFWGYGKYGVEYNGRKSGGGKDDTTIELRWKLGHFKREDEKKREAECEVRKRRMINRLNKKKS